MAFAATLLLTLHSVLASIFPKEDECKHCANAPAGFCPDVSDFSSCGDCLRRRVAIKLMTARGIWLDLNKPTSDTLRVLDSLCAKKGFRYSYELADIYRKAGFSSKWFPLEKDPNSPENDRIFVLFKKRVKAAAPGQEVKVPEDDKFMGVDLTPIEEDPISHDSFLWFHQQSLNNQSLLSEEEFLLMVPNLLESEAEGWLQIDPAHYLESVKCRVGTRVSFSKKNCNFNEALSVQAICQKTVVPSLIKDGKMTEVNYIRQLSGQVVDNSSGVSLYRDIESFKLKDEFCVNFAEYNNLFFTCALHCDSLEDPLPLEPRRGRCQLHSLGMASGNHPIHVEKEDWIPLDYCSHGVVPNLLAQKKPLLSGLTQALLTASKLPVSLASYLVSEAVRVASPYTSLIPAVQATLLAKFGSGPQIPSSLVSKLVGKDFSEASAIIHSRREEVPSGAPKREESKIDELLRLLKGRGPSSGPSPGRSPSPGGESRKFLGYNVKTEKQAKRLSKAFGGDFRSFLRLKKKDKLKGKLDLLKLCNFYEDGKQKFGKKTLKEVIKTCSIN